MSGLDQTLAIDAVYTRSINLSRDGNARELVQAYLPTSRAVQALEQMAGGLGQAAQNRALALNGPYGSGKSALGLFAGALLSAPDGALHQTAAGVLAQTDAALAARFRAAVAHSFGSPLKVLINPRLGDLP